MRKMTLSLVALERFVLNVSKQAHQMKEETTFIPSATMELSDKLILNCMIHW